jgi:hypothetical protein
VRGHQATVTHYYIGRTRIDHVEPIGRITLRSSPDVAHERGFLLAVAARIAHHDQDPDAAQLEKEASGTQRSLGVVRVPLPEFAS